MCNICHSWSIQQKVELHKLFMQFHRILYFFVIRCQISRTQSTNEEPIMIIIQSISFSPSTLKNCCKPGNSTIAI